jgi:hypothetical protein
MDHGKGEHVPNSMTFVFEFFTGSDATTVKVTFTASGKAYFLCFYQIKISKNVLKVKPGFTWFSWV